MPSDQVTAPLRGPRGLVPLVPASCLPPWPQSGAVTSGHLPSSASGGLPNKETPGDGSRLISTAQPNQSLPSTPTQMQIPQNGTSPKCSESEKRPD